MNVVFGLPGDGINGMEVAVFNELARRCYLRHFLLIGRDVTRSQQALVIVD